VKILSAILCCWFALGNPSGRKEATPLFASQSDGDRNAIAPGIVVVKLAATNAVRASDRMAKLAAMAQTDGVVLSDLRPLHNVKNRSTLARFEDSIDRIFLLRYKGTAPPDKVVGLLSGVDGIEYAEPLFVYPENHTPNDPRISQQWAVAMMKLNEAWDITQGDSTIVIADVGSGIDWSHPDLQMNAFLNKGEWGQAGELRDNGVDDDRNGKTDDWHGWDFVGSGTVEMPLPDNNPMDGATGHGTSTAGCIAARTNNGLGIASPGYHAKVLPVKVEGDAASGVFLGLEGIVYAADMGCKIINCSWGGGGVRSQALQDVIDYAHAKGSVLIVSAGNTSKDCDRYPRWPSSYRNVLNVSSIEADGSPSSWACNGTSVSLYAPGSGIVTTRKGGGYETQSGTSYAAPLVAGVAALVLSRHPDWTPDQVMKQLRVTSDPFSLPRDPKQYGRINALAAVSLNDNLDDIPGILASDISVTTSSGETITEIGQEVNVSFSLTNVLARTDASTQAILEIEDPSLLVTSNTVRQLGSIPTMGTATLDFTLHFASTPVLSEGYLPIRLKIIDSNYVDYVPARVQVKLTHGWHTSLRVDLPVFTSVDAVNDSSVWATADVYRTQAFCFVSSDRGVTWEAASGNGFPQNRGVYTLRASSMNNALIGTGPQDSLAEVFRTTDKGQTWNKSIVSAITPFVNGIVIFDSNNGTLLGNPLAGRWGLGKTTDGGIHWELFDTPPTALPFEQGFPGSYDAVASTIWFGTNANRILRSTDLGESWQSIAVPYPNVVSISFRNESIGVLRSTRTNSSGENLLAITRDGGLQWTTISSIKPELASAVKMERGGNRLWLFSGGNAFVSRDLGQTWVIEATPDEFDPLLVTDEWNDAMTTCMYAAGVNLYASQSAFEKHTTTEHSEVFVPTGLELRSVFPNPAVASVLVSFSLATLSRATLVLFTSNGTQLRIVLDATLAQGNHSCRIDCSSLETGTYYLQLSDGRHFVKNKFVLVK